MKSVIIIATLLLTVNFVIANEIDSLKTNQEVQNFLVEKVYNKWKEFNFFEGTTKDTSKYGKFKFFKTDLDNNGLTDLIINGTYFFAVVDKGNGNYKTYSIDRGAFSLDKYTLKNIIYTNKQPLLVINGYNDLNFSIQDTTKTDTLILNSDGFIEYNPFPDDLKIEKINFSTSPCYGKCPIFKMTINDKRIATFQAIEYNEKTGNFTATIDSSSYNNLVETINYIKLSSLKNDYAVSWTDDQTATLEITFNNGQTKTINDYGEIGTFGLANLYNQLFLLRKTQKWK